MISTYAKVSNGKNDSNSPNFKEKKSQITRFLLVAKNIEGFCFLSTFISSM
jgi:hypothetical protein